MITIKKKDAKKDLNRQQVTPLPSPNPTPRPLTNRDRPRPTDLHGRSKALFRVWRCIEAQDLQRLPNNFWLFRNSERNLGLRWTEDAYRSLMSVAHELCTLEIAASKLGQLGPQCLKLQGSNGEEILGYLGCSSPTKSCFPTGCSSQVDSRGTWISWMIWICYVWIK